MSPALKITSKKATQLTLLFFFALAFVFASYTAFGSPAYAASAPVNQCNGTDNVGGESVECAVTVVNNLDQATGVTSSTLTIKECHGAANTVPTCITKTTTSTDLILSVDQCNGSGNGGGASVKCSVDVTNNVVGPGTPSSVTVNQCNNSGQGGGTAPTILCDPIGVTTNATVDQCNTSGQGGGATERVKCNVGTASVETAFIPVKIVQCDSSGNGGGGIVICATALTAKFTPAASTTPTPVTATPTPVTATPTVVAPPKASTPVAPPTTVTAPPVKKLASTGVSQVTADRDSALAIGGSILTLLGVALTIFNRRRSMV